MRPSVIICANRVSASYICKKIGVFSPNYHFNKSHFQFPNKSGITVATWEQAYAMVVPETFPHKVFVQGEEPAEEFLQTVVVYYAPSKEQHKKNFEELKALFPEFTYEETEDLLDFRARLVRKNYKSPVDLEDIEKGYEYLFLEWLDHKIFESYTQQYPFLYVYGMKNYWDTQENTLYVSTIHPNYPKHEGTTTGFRPSYPLSQEDAAELSRLNSQAQKYVEEKDNFFCSGCRQTLPRDQYAAYLFSVVKCKACATPQFIKAAREETYN